MRDPFVGAVVRAHRWFKAGQLQARLGGSIPEALWRGLEVYDSALNAVQVHDIEAERKRVEEADRLADQQAHGMQRPIVTRRHLPRAR